MNLTETRRAVQRIFKEEIGPIEGVAWVRVVCGHNSFKVKAIGYATMFLTPRMEERAFEAFKVAADRCVKEDIVDPTKSSLLWEGLSAEE
jgi:hypothetical protein